MAAAGVEACLGLQFQGHADLMTARIKVLAVNHGRQEQCDAVTQLLLIAQTYLAGIVHFGAQSGFFVQLQFGAQAKLGVVGFREPGQLHAHVQFVGHLMENGANKLLAVVPARIGSSSSIVR